MQPPRYPMLCALLGAVVALACDANVVEAVLEPPVVADPEPEPEPEPEPSKRP
jgi:hypothetical protein